MKALAAAIICISLVLMPVKTAESEYETLLERREELKDYIGTLKTEIAGKKARLESIDEELERLQKEYDRLLAEREEIRRRIDSLRQVEQ